MEMQLFILGHVILFAICVALMRCMMSDVRRVEEKMASGLVFSLYLFAFFELIYWILLEFFKSDGSYDRLKNYLGFGNEGIFILRQFTPLGK